MTESDSEHETRIDELEEENEELRERLESIETMIPDEDEDSGRMPEISRRGTLAALAGAGAVGVGATGTASADVADSDIIGRNFSANVEPGRIVSFQNTAGSGQAFGLRATTESGNANAILGRNYASTGPALGIRGQTDSDNGTAVIGVATSSTGKTFGLRGESQSSEGRGLSGEARDTSGNTIGLRGLAQSPNGEAIRGVNNAGSGTPVAVKATTPNADGLGLHSTEDVQIDGDLQVAGTKNFVQAVETPSGSKEVVYTAVESGTPRTEATDVAELSDGRAEIELPDHFEMVTSEDEPLSVQVTPYAKEEANPQVVEHSTERLVVEDFSDEAREYTFAYTVKGVREGFEDREVVQDS